MTDFHEVQGRTPDAVHVFADAGPDIVHSPDLPVPYMLTPEAEAALDAEAEAAPGPEWEAEPW